MAYIFQHLQCLEIHKIPSFRTFPPPPTRWPVVTGGSHLLASTSRWLYRRAAADRRWTFRTRTLCQGVGRWHTKPCGVSAWKITPGCRNLKRHFNVILGFFGGEDGKSNHTHDGEAKKGWKTWFFCWVDSGGKGCEKYHENRHSKLQLLFACIVKQYYLISFTLSEVQQIFGKWSGVSHNLISQFRKIKPVWTFELFNLNHFRSCQNVFIICNFPWFTLSDLARDRRRTLLQRISCCQSLWNW